MKSRFSVEQIIKILRECEVSDNKIEICQKHNISQQTYYRWRSKHQGMDVQEALKLKALEKENTELKKLVAELSLQVFLSACTYIKDNQSIPIPKNIIS